MFTVFFILVLRVSMLTFANYNQTQSSPKVDGNVISFCKYLVIKKTRVLDKVEF